MGRSRKMISKEQKSPDKRKKKKSPIMTDKTKIDQSGNEFLGPRDRYIRTEETLEQIAKRYGKNLSALKMKAAKEKWTDKRKEFQSMVNRGVEQAIKEKFDNEADEIEKVRKHHFDLGKFCTLVGETFFKNGAPVTRNIKCPHCDESHVHTIRLSGMEMMNPSVGLRALKEGVEIQRKGLGLADLTVTVNHTREIAVDILNVIRTYVVDPDIYRSISTGIRSIVRREEDNLKSLKQIDNPIDFGNG